MKPFSILILSGLLGILLGDTFLFSALRLVGSGPNAIMFARNAPLKVLAGNYVLNEMLSFLILCSNLTVTAGVTTSIIFGEVRLDVNSWNELHGSLPLGLLFGFLAGVGHAVGIILTRTFLD